MIIDFKCSNFKSFRDEQCFSMQRPSSLSYKKDTISFNDISLTRVAAFYGANAAGKSNFINSILFLRDIIVNGRIESDCFISCHDEIYFYISFLMLGKRYEYEISFVESRILRESLKIYKTLQPTNVFSFDVVDGLKMGSMFERDEKIAIKFNFEKNPKQPIMGQLEKSNSDDAKCAYAFFRDGVFSDSSRGYGVESVQTKLKQFLENAPDLRNFMKKLLPFADFGVKSVNLIEKDSNDKIKDILYDAVRSASELDKRFKTDRQKEILDRMLTIEKQKEVVFEHEIDGDKTTFGIKHESDGTVAMSGILVDLWLVLNAGLVYIVDELDRSLHPSLVAQIIDIFNNSNTNPNNAQLIFTTHDISLLDSSVYGEDILDRDQVWFVEKDNDGSSEIYPLYSIKYETRKNDNYYKKYIEGKYGAVPKLSLSYAIRSYWDQQAVSSSERSCNEISR